MPHDQNELLTESLVRNAAGPDGVTKSGKPQKDVILRDSEVIGFCCRIGASGRRSFFAEYNVRNIKRRVSLGAWGIVTVAQARKQAKAVLGQVAAGADPAATRKAEVAAAQVAAVSLDSLVDEWVAARADKGRRDAYLTPAAQLLRLHLKSWLLKPAVAITKAAAIARLDEIKQSSGISAANHTLAYARACLGWAVRRQTLPVNPFAGIEPPGAAQSRARVLTINECTAIWRAAGEVPAPYDSFVRVLMLTLQRRGEVAGMQWREISDDGRTWLLPADRAKNHRAHIIHLSEPVRVILATLPRIKDNLFVFGRALNAFSFAKRRLDAAITKERKETGIEPPELIPWTWHDFRRAGVTALADMGVAPHIADKLLGHETGSLSSIALVYQRSEFLPEREAALNQWSDAVMAGVGSDTEAAEIEQY